VYCFEERYRNKSWTETLLAYDMFGARIPTFNFEGRNKVGSPTGLVATVFFVVLLGSFAGFKVSRLITGGNPLISESMEIDFYDENERIVLDKINMLGAF
jgi:hypothetical protein